MRIQGAVREEGGVAMIMALVVVLILAAIVLAMTFMTTAEVDTHRLSRWDTFAQYVAQAGIEHQIYLLKGDKNACAVPYQQYPVLSGETPGLGVWWYVTALTCIATPGDTCTLDVTTGCPTGNPTSRRWTIDSFGENWDCPTPCSTLRHQRTIRAQVDITYVTCAATNGCPSSVTLLRWERVEP